MPRSYGTTNAVPYTAAPAVGAAGDMYYNSTSKVLYISDGAAWIAAGGGAGADEVFIGTSDPGSSYELWYDTDAPSPNPAGGIPPGGDYNDLLIKVGATDYDTEWRPPGLLAVGYWLWEQATLDLGTVDPGPGEVGVNSDFPDEATYAALTWIDADGFDLVTALGDIANKALRIRIFDDVDGSVLNAEVTAMDAWSLEIVRFHLVNATSSTEPASSTRCRIEFWERYTGVPPAGVAGEVLTKTDTAIDWEMAWQPLPTPQFVGPNPLAVGQETMDRAFCTGGSAMTSQLMRLTYFTARKTETITQIRVVTGTPGAAATPTLIRFGIYTVAAGTQDLTLVASTANDTTLLSAATTRYTKALQASYPLVAGTRYAFAALLVSAATVPQLVTGTHNTVGEGAVEPRVAAQLSGQADLGGSYTNASLSQGGAFVYAALLP
jgi:hypothetical protein